MSTKSNLIRALALSLMASFATASAQAEISQREQQEAAQKAYEESAKTHEEVAAEWEKIKKDFEITRDAAKLIFDGLGVFK